MAVAPPKDSVRVEVWASVAREAAEPCGVRPPLPRLSHALARACHRSRARANPWTTVQTTLMSWVPTMTPIAMGIVLW